MSPVSVTKVFISDSHYYEMTIGDTRVRVLDVNKDGRLRLDAKDRLTQVMRGRVEKQRFDLAFYKKHGVAIEKAMAPYADLITAKLKQDEADLKQAERRIETAMICVRLHCDYYFFGKDITGWSAVYGASSVHDYNNDGLVDLYKSEINGTLVRVGTPLLNQHCLLKRRSDVINYSLNFDRRPVAAILDRFNREPMPNLTTYHPNELIGSVDECLDAKKKRLGD